MTDLLAFWDFLACAAAGEAALGWYAHYVLRRPMDFPTSGPFWRDILFGSLITALVLRTGGGALHGRVLSTRRLVLVAERQCFLAFTVLIAVGLLTRATDDLAKLWLLSWFAMFAATVGCTRVAWGRYLQRLHDNGGLREAVAIIGGEGACARMASRIAGEADVVGLFDAPASQDQDNQTQDDHLKQLFALGRDGGLDSVILALDHGQFEGVGEIIEQLKALPVQVVVCSDDGWPSEALPQMRMFGGIPMTVVADRPIKYWNLLIKTMLDKLGALLLLLALAPLLLGIAMAVAATSPGPVIFRQYRRGWCGREFVIFKFRSMFCNSHPRLEQTRRGDQRCTSVGRLLRSCSLDELPQLWNVLRGDMSLVGPRPHAEAMHELDRAGREIVAEYAQRHRVKPGLTGWAQVNGARGATTSLAQLRRRVEFDLYYIENWSLELDIRILLRTPFSMAGENVF